MTTHNTQAIVHGIFDKATWTVTYIVHSGVGTACAIIDSVLDYDPKSGRTSTTSADKVVAYVQANQLQVAWILETHAHADHVSAAPYLKKHLGGKTAIGTRITQVQKVFKGIFNLETSFKEDGSQFDQLLDSDEEFKVGELIGKVLFVPGHTPACVRGRPAPAAAAPRLRRPPLWQRPEWPADGGAPPNRRNSADPWEFWWSR